MKKLITMALAAGLFLSACNKTAVDPQDTYTATAAVESALRKQAPDASNVSYTEVSPMAVEATYSLKREDMVAGISKGGKLLYNGPVVEDAQLPAIALDYLAATYPGYELKKAMEKKDKAGVTQGFAANIKHEGKKYHLHFDATGKFIESVEKSGKHYGQGEKITKADLNATTAAYLDATYPGYIFVDGYKFVVDGTVKGYGIRINTADGKEVGLMFDGTGAFLRSREGDLGHGGHGMGPKGGNDKNHHGRGNDGVAVVKIEKTDLPATTLSYLDTKYAGYTLKKAAKISQNGTLINYAAEIKLNDKSIHLLFDATGAFVKEGKK